VKCVVFIVDTRTVDMLQCYYDVRGDYCGDINSRYTAMVLCYVGVYCGYSNSSYNVMVLCFDEFYCGDSNSRYSAMVPCCVWSLLWLQQH